MIELSVAMLMSWGIHMYILIQIAIFPILFDLDSCSKTTRVSIIMAGSMLVLISVVRLYLNTWLFDLPINNDTFYIRWPMYDFVYLIVLLFTVYYVSNSDADIRELGDINQQPYTLDNKPNRITRVYHHLNVFHKPYRLTYE